MGVPQCKTPLISGNTVFILLSGKEAKTGRHEGQESSWRAVRVQQSYCSPSHLHPALSAAQQLPEVDLSLAPVPLCVASVPCPWLLRLSPRQQLGAAIGYGIWISCSTQARHTFICKNQAGMFQHWHQLLIGFQKRDFSHLHVIKPY